MTKIKITKEIKELDGTVIEKSVTPFGTSAHIAFGKQHTGKIVDVVIPTEPEYTWILSLADLNSIVNACNKVLDKQGENKLTFFRRENIKNIQSKRFSFEDLQKVLEILKEDKKNSVLAEKFKKSYNL